MGTGASENIAIAVTTSAELSALSAAEAKLGSLGKTAVSVGGSINGQIGAFEALGKTVDVKSAAAVQAYRAQGDALSTNLVKLGATDAEVNRVGGAIAKLERAAGASLLDPRSPQSIGLAALPNKTRTAANAMGVLSQSAVTGSGSISSLANAVGGLSYGLSGLATSAKAVAAATWITLLIQAAVLAYNVFDGFKKKTRELNNELGDLTSERKGMIDALGGDDLAQKIEQINHGAEKQIQQAKEIGFLYKGHREEIVNGINANRQKSIELANTQFQNEVAARARERQDRIAGGALSLALEQERTAGRKSEFELQVIAVANEQRLRDTEIRRSFERRSASGAIIALTDEEITQLNKLLDENNKLTDAKRTQLLTEGQIAREQARASQLQGSDRFGDRFQGRLEEIELERRAQIRATGDIATANAVAEQRIRALRRETAREASENAKTIFEVLRSTNDKTLKAVGTFGENLRRIVIGAEAAKALVRAAVEGAEAVASLAIGDFRGAALHGAAAVQFGAAAALGARESLGGGGSGGGGGGGSGGGPTFTPRETAQGGNVTVILQSIDPRNQNVIDEVSWQLQRNGITNRPISRSTSSGALRPALAGVQYS